MKVILLDAVAKLGSVGDEVEVKNGYGRNFLIPQKLAVRATAQSRAHFESVRKELEAAAAVKLAAAKEVAAKVEELGSIEIVVPAGAEGRLFGSVTNRQIAEVLEAVGVNVDKAQVRVPGSVLRELGEHTVQLHLHSAVITPLLVKVLAS